MREEKKIMKKIRIMSKGKVVWQGEYDPAINEKTMAEMQDAMLKRSKQSLHEWLDEKRKEYDKGE
jgi:hypothetical protein